eukprot:7134260-Prymnesium_polylepis.1
MAAATEIYAHVLTHTALSVCPAPALLCLSPPMSPTHPVPSPARLLAVWPPQTAASLPCLRAVGPAVLPLPLSLLPMLALAARRCPLPLANLSLSAAASARPVCDSDCVFRFWADLADPMCPGSPYPGRSAHPQAAAAQGTSGEGPGASVDRFPGRGMD